MKKILISTILRDAESKIDRWYNQVKSLVSIDRNNEYYISLYENDSKDKTIEKIKNLDFTVFRNFKIESEKLNTPKFGSVINEQRVRLLAQARNKTLYNNTFLKKCSHVLVIEPDISYNPSHVLNEIINNQNYDIISARSVTNTLKIYDQWATRQTESDHQWSQSKYYEPTFGALPMWSTFNCFCLYNANPIKQGITFDGYNYRFDKYDCDTAVICENFRKNGYNNIVLNASIEVNHDIN